MWGFRPHFPSVWLDARVVGYGMLPTMASGWTEQEVVESVRAYLEMLRKELASEPYVKSEVNQALREGTLRNRSKASVEYRMRNISAVLDESGLPWIRGTGPLRRSGKGYAKLL